MLAIENMSEYFFVNRLDRTGKTFLYNILFMSVRLHEKITVTVVSSGIATLLISSDRTVYFWFKILI